MGLNKGKIERKACNIIGNTRGDKDDKNSKNASIALNKDIQTIGNGGDSSDKGNSQFRTHEEQQCDI